MTHAEIETRLVEIVALALHMDAPDALKVHRLLRDAADDLLRIIAVAPLPMMPRKDTVPTVATPEPSGVVGIKAAAKMLVKRRLTPSPDRRPSRKITVGIVSNPRPAHIRAAPGPPAR